MKKLYETESEIYCELTYASKYSVEEVAKVAQGMPAHFNKMGWPTSRVSSEAKFVRATVWLGQAILSQHLKKCWCSHYEGVKY